MRLPFGFGVLLAAVMALVMPGEPAATAVFAADAVQCFPLAAIPSGPSAAHSLNRAQGSVEDVRATMAAYVVPALQAAEHCLSGQCEAAAAKTLRGALKPYLAARRTMTTKLFLEQGLAGLGRADDVFASPEDFALARDLAKLHAAGKLDFASFGEDKEALALLVLHPASGFRPCNVSRAIIQASAGNIRL
ncbi:MAG: hypothetical protein ABL907_21110 [Hyphomicrobium sp.]